MVNAGRHAERWRCGTLTHRVKSDLECWGSQLWKGVNYLRQLPQVHSCSVMGLVSGGVLGFTMNSKRMVDGWGELITLRQVFDHEPQPFSHKNHDATGVEGGQSRIEEAIYSSIPV